MSEILPWSYSSLNEFSTCPYAYYHKHVLKDLPKQVETPELKTGKFVHTQFENYVKYDGRKELDSSLIGHRDYLDGLRTAYGDKKTELKWGLTKDLQPTAFFGEDVWARGVIDYQREYHFKDEHDPKKLHTAYKMVDYKTGAKKNVSEKQLKLFALYGFAAGASLVTTEYYWTSDHTTTKKVYGIKEAKDMWGDFIPDLKQYKDAFKTDTWQKRPNGLCHGYCEVKKCTHWKPKKEK
jgi:RecB family exonuclease